MASNLPGQQQTVNSVMPITGNLVSTIPMGVPPLAQLSPSVPSVTQQQQQQQQQQPQQSNQQQQLPSLVPTTVAASMVSSATAPHTTAATHTKNTNTAAAANATAAAASSLAAAILQSHNHDGQMLSRMRLQDLVREVDPTEQLDEEVEELLVQLADDFVESTVNAACQLAKHRKASTVEVKDVQLHLERNWNMWIPGFGTDELRPYKRAPVTEAHKQRLALIRKALKKY